LLKDAPIVLLDEVTSALDPVNEAAVHAGIEELMAGRTVVLVAHRMGTVRRADRVAFLDAGRVVEQGSHEELLGRAGRYAAYWDLSLAAAARD
jgi:ATP-binding cassette subfamily B protein